MRVLVCGSRDYDRKAFVWDTLDALHAKTPITLLITGHARGADTLADQWGMKRGVDRVLFPANWEGRGNVAGPIRNGRMLRIARPELVVAFPSTGPGTANMIEQAERAGVTVQRIEPLRGRIDR